MTVRLRRENCCEMCTRPRHIGSLCAPCFYGASPARRATELLAHGAASDDQPTMPFDSVAVALCVELEAIFELPAVEPRRAA